MIVDGKKLAADVYEELAKERASLPAGLSLGIIACEPDAVIESFVRIKERAAARLGVALVRRDVPASAGEKGILAAMEELAGATAGIIVQLPLPKNIDVEKVLAAIPGSKDVDGIGGAPACEPPVALAIEEILAQNGIEAGGKNAVVIGAGRLVGAPAAKLLERLGAHVRVMTREEGSTELLKDADIIVSGAGEPGLITPDMIRDGAVLIDAGTSESSGKVRGDAEPACAEKCSVFTPVPGGVGPVAVAMIFKNLFALARGKLS